MWAKQSTAATLIVGPILDSTGAEYTSAVIGDLSHSKNGGTLTALASAATLTHIANGQYTLVMTTGNLDTLGRLQITCNKSTYQMPPIGLVVVPAMVFDSMVLGTDVLQSDVTQFGGAAGTFAAGIPTAELDSTATAALVDLIWDEPLTGATHNVATSSGKRLRQTTAFQQIDSTVIDASATTTTFITGLTSSVDNFYNDSMLVFTDGALAGQVRAIYDYIGATKTIILEEALTSAPVNGVAFAIVSLHIHPVSQIQNGLALAATALSTTQWSNGLATDLGTTNTTVATNLNATVSSRSTQTSVDTIDDLLDTEIPALTAAVAAEAVKTSAIKAKTDNLPTDPADQSLVEAAITAATSPLATPAQVNAEVVDALSVDTYAELSAPPAATSSLKDKLTWLFMYARNKVTQTATTRTLYRDDTTTVAGTSGTSDNGTTFTKGEDA